MTVLYLVCDHPQQRLQIGVRLWSVVTVVSAAAGVADVELDPSIRDDFIRATEFSVHTTLSRQNVEGAVVSSGAGAALIRQTLAGEVGAGLAFVLQGTVVTQQAVEAQSR